MKFKNISLMALGGVCCCAMAAWAANTSIPGTYLVEQKCPSGSYCPGDGNKYACPSNATCSTTGLIEPKCKTGYHFMDGKCWSDAASICCPVGQYSQDGYSTCLKCPSGTTTLQPCTYGKDKCVALMSCDPGMYPEEPQNCNLVYAQKLSGGLTQTCYGCKECKSGYQLDSNGKCVAANTCRYNYTKTLSTVMDRKMVCESDKPLCENGTCVACPGDLVYDVSATKCVSPSTFWCKGNYGTGTPDDCPKGFPYCVNSHCTATLTCPGDTLKQCSEGFIPKLYKTLPDGTNCYYCSECKAGYIWKDGKCIAQVEKCSGNAHTIGTNPCGDELPYCDNGVCTKCPNNGIFEPNYQKCRARCEVNEQFNYSTFKCEPLAKQCPNGYVTSKGCVKECSSLTGFPYVLHEDGLSSTKCVTKEECLSLNYDVVLTDGSCRKKKECPAWYSYDSQTGTCKEVVCKPGDYRTRAGMYEGHIMYACSGCLPGNYCPDGKESIVCPAGTTSQGAAKSVKECVPTNTCKYGFGISGSPCTEDKPFCDNGVCIKCPDHSSYSLNYQKCQPLCPANSIFDYDAWKCVEAPLTCPSDMFPVNGRCCFKSNAIDGGCSKCVTHPAKDGCPEYTECWSVPCTCPAGYSQTKPSCNNGKLDIVPLNPSLGPNGPMCYKCDVQKCTADYGAKTPAACGKDLPYCINGVCQTKKPCTTKQYGYNGTCRTCPANATCDGRVFTCKANYYKYETLCRACPSNATCNGETFTCKAGYYKKGNTCTKCPTNATCTAESFTCAAGFYQTTSSCVKCATNTVSKPGDTQCTKCTNGVANKDHTQCEPCATGTFFNGTSCSKCPTNAKCTGGVMACNTGYKKSGNTCIKDWRKT